MKTLIKVILTIAVLNAAAQVGLAAYGYFQLKDASQEILTFGSQITTDEIRDDIFAKAQSLELPLTASDVVVRREGPKTYAQASYTQPVEVLPSVTYPITFRFSVDALQMTGLGAGPAPVRHP